MPAIFIRRVSARSVRRCSHELGSQSELCNIGQCLNLILQTLLKLRLPAALPFIFNALKINTTLAMIGAIVAEFFGTPTVGMGFRISTEVGHLSIDMVWATIVVAAVTGSTFYAIVAMIERRATFWHASYRAR